MSPDSPNGEKNILIVDDEMDVRMILCAILAKEGYKVHEATDGRDALDMLADRKFDLMFLDLMMPRLTGEEVLEHLKREVRLSDMPVIVLTAKAERKDVTRGYEGGASFYVIKPFSNTAIRELARYHLGDLSDEEKEDLLFSLMQ